jgi:predicted N-acetyltransferase YhbS
MPVADSPFAHASRSIPSVDFTIRAMRRTETAEVCALLALAFDEAAPEMFVAQTERDSTFRLRHGRVAIVKGATSSGPLVDGRIAGYVRIFARTMLIRGVPLAAGGIGSVATHPEYRRAGIATALMRDAIEQMRREGMVVSFLFTGIPVFYERLGYRVVREPYFAFSRQDLLDARWPRYHAVRSISYQDIAALLRVYRRVTGGTTGAMARTQQTWLDMGFWLRFPGGHAARDRKGAIIGYLFSRCTPFGHQILEAECAAGHEAVMHELLGATAHDNCNCGDTFVALVPDPSTLAATLRALPGTIEEPAFRYPMMVRSLIDDAAMDAALDEDPMHFWNTDRI